MFFICSSDLSIAAGCLGCIIGGLVSKKIGSATVAFFQLLRVVDISPFIEKKVESNVVCKTQGPGGDSGARLRKKLAEEGKKLEILDKT